MSTTETRHPSTTEAYGPPSVTTRVVNPTTIYCPRALPDLWRQADPGQPPPLATRWREQYPDLFDEDDLALLVNQARRGYHFYEWYAAIHLFQRDGSRSLVEKYDTYENHRLNHRRQGHRRKVAEYERVVPESQRQVLHEICSLCRAQLPDLLVMPADGTSFAFAEVKGATDGSLHRQGQRCVRDAILQRLGVPVEVIRVCLGPAPGGGSQAPGS
jgi:hypothetical protein